MPGRVTHVGTSSCRGQALTRATASGIGSDGDGNRDDCRPRTRGWRSRCVAPSAIRWKTASRRSSLKPTDGIDATHLPKHVKIVDVGPRDGLQNQPERVALETKIRLVEMLADAGLPVWSRRALSSPPKWVPQHGRACAELMQRIDRKPGVSYPVLEAEHEGLRSSEGGRRR